MNYRHAYHAGNPADVIKHAVLAWILSYFNRKEAPYAYIDSHAGIGAYDLKGEAALRTGEWVEGIGRLYRADLPPAMAEALAPYLASVRDLNPDGALRYYPGSPAIAQELCRLQDRILLTEKHPVDAALLKDNMARDKRVKVLNQDGWLAAKAFLPPKERRGVMMIDPPFEEADDFAKMLAAARQALQRFETGTLILWYPVKDADAVNGFLGAMHDLDLKKWLNLTLVLRPIGSAGLPGSGLYIINPPFGLRDAFAATAPFWPAALQAPSARLTLEGRDG